MNRLCVQHGVQPVIDAMAKTQTEPMLEWARNALKGEMDALRAKAEAAEEESRKASHALGLIGDADEFTRMQDDLKNMQDELDR